MSNNINHPGFVSGLKLCIMRNRKKPARSRRPRTRRDHKRPTKKDRFKKVSQAALWLRVQPFIPFMRKILKGKGFPVGKNTEETTLNFAKYILKKQIPVSHALDGNGQEVEYLAPAVISGIIQAVISFFGFLSKKVEAKKETGETVTPEEQKLVESYQTVKTVAKEGATGEPETKNDDGGINELLKNPLVLGGLAYILLKK